MGMTKRYLDDINDSAVKAIGGFQNKRMLEFGNQCFHDNSVPEKTGKEYFRNKGCVEHVSLDLNGLDGAVKVDLSKPIRNDSWHSYFDIVTNFGTTEHVEPFKAQYVCFSSIHNCLKVGGIAMHILPDINELKKNGFLKGHCFNYYSFDFFKMLTENNNYKLISLKLLGDGHLWACLQKMQDAPFMGDSVKFLGKISREKEGVIYRGINDRGMIWFRGLPKRLVLPVYYFLGLQKLRRKFFPKKTDASAG